ncbi:LOW QUALITY PROTEIN: unconventional myosin-Ib-like [Homalodisca vitripennis]|nr:LOW QUALITY PROTEIN: unconventional myosin-Ib-like [Homalodisca vitripennis]
MTKTRTHRNSTAEVSQICDKNTELPMTKTRTHRNSTAENWDIVNNAEDAETAYNNFNEILSIALDIACPKRKSKTRVGSKPSHYYDSECAEMKASYIRALNIYETTGNTRDKEEMCGVFYRFAVAGSAYRWLRDCNQDQCVVVSGESGSGKTEAARMVLHFITVTPVTLLADDVIRERLLQSAPLLEAFGNAKTYRNDNSSRFGKYMDIEFDYKGDPLGGTITNCKFSFYYLILNPQLIQKQRYAFLTVLGSADIMSLLKFCLSSELYEVCDLLETEPSCLQTAVTSRALQVTDSSDPPLVTELSASEATHARDALCKALYSRLFTWLVNRINEAIKVRRYGKRRVLGILDVYGFEMLEKNGFEQFVINFCNEKLHQVITEATLKQEQEEYQREDITWTPVDFFNNSNVCHLIEKNNHGILSILDEESGKLAVSDEVFLSRVTALCGHSHTTPERRNRHTPSADNSLPPNCFRLRHFAGTVTYNVTGFIEKNNDFLPRDISMAMYRCQHPLLKTLFPEGNPKRACVKRPVTTGTQFKIAIQGLIRNLTTKQPHYVRCIKPNELKQPRIFEMALVQHQVRYLGLLETVRVRRCGFCFRLSYSQFLARYKMLSLQTWPCWLGTAVEGVSYLLRDLPIPPAEFAFGRTKIFVRSPRSVFELEEFRRERLEDLATLIQKIWRGYRQRKDFLRRRRSQIIIAAAWRSWRVRQPSLFTFYF